MGFLGVTKGALATDVLVAVIIEGNSVVTEESMPTKQ